MVCWRTSRISDAKFVIGVDYVQSCYESEGGPHRFPSRAQFELSRKVPCCWKPRGGNGAETRKLSPVTLGVVVSQRLVGLLPLWFTMCQGLAQPGRESD
jgi:hypothetical protein